MATDFFLTNTASDLSLGGTTLRLSLVRGAGLTVSTTNTVAGPTSGVQCTASAGGSVLVWITNPLDAVTISSTVTSNFWMAESGMTANATERRLIERTDGAGTVLETIVSAAKGTELGTSRAAVNDGIATGGTTLSPGDRIKLTVLIDDADALTMASGLTCTLGYGATSGAVDGDSWVRFVATITEYVAATYSGRPDRVYPQLLAQ